MQTSISKNIQVAVSQRQQDCCARFVSNWHSPVVIALHQGHALSTSRGIPHFHMVWISTRFSPEGRWPSALHHAWWHYPHGTQDTQQKAGERHCIALWIIKSVSVPEYWEHAALLLRQHRPHRKSLPTSTIPPWIPLQDPSPELLGCMAGLGPQEQVRTADSGRLWAQRRASVLKQGVTHC